MFNATTATLSQLRAFASDNGISIEGDRRRKQSYIDAIQAWQADVDFDSLLDTALAVNRGEITEEEALEISNATLADASPLVQAIVEAVNSSQHVEDADISVEELEAEELSWQETVEQEESPVESTGFAPMLLLIIQTVLVILALPLVLVGGILKAAAWGIEKLADWLASPKPGRWGSIQSLVLAIP